jgi:hypothetical protein
MSERDFLEDDEGEGQPPVYYTVEEARALLPEVIPHLRAIQKQALHFKEVQDAVREASGGLLLADGNLAADPFFEQDEEQFRRDSDAFDLAVRRLQELGVEVKDPERGLIDFYHVRDGVVVYLCFELGEETITHWHTQASGYAGRTPL